MSAESKKPSCQQLIVPRFITKPSKRHFSRNAAVLSMSRPKASSLLTSVNNLAQHYRQKPKLVALLLSVYTTLQLCLPFGCDMKSASAIKTKRLFRATTLPSRHWQRNEVAVYMWSWCPEMWGRILFCCFQAKTWYGINELVWYLLKLKTTTPPSGSQVLLFSFLKSTTKAHHTCPIEMNYKPWSLSYGLKPFFFVGVYF